MCLELNKLNFPIDSIDFLIVTRSETAQDVKNVLEILLFDIILKDNWQIKTKRLKQIKTEAKIKYYLHSNRNS